MPGSMYLSSRPPVVCLLGFAWCACTPAAADPAPFVEIAAETGLDFVHFNGMTGKEYFSEMMGAGVALIDYDGDGDLDVYLVQGQLLGDGETMEDARIPIKGEPPFSDRLYRNDLRWVDGEPVLKFTDVTREAGIDSTGYGMGVATGDVNNDGHPDIYVTNFGENLLLVNRGNGRFDNITEESGARDDRWSVSAAFLDFDRDGWLDLFIGNYVNYSLRSHQTCRLPNGLPDYCSPSAYQPVNDRFLRNLGGGKFVNASSQVGIDRTFGAALGVIAADFNGDGWVDVYVANDGSENQLWMNDQKGRLRDESLLAGAAVNMEGKAEASMGVSAEDFDGDGDIDLFMTHLSRETNTLYVNDGQGWFEDRTMSLALGQTSLAATGFGTAWFDYDNDGWMDLFSANGAVTKIESQIDEEILPLRQTNQLWRNRGGDRGFDEVSASAGAALALSEVSRGAAFGDIDNDGDADIVVTNNAGPVRLLQNRVGQDGHWLGVRMLTADGKRDALGASLTLRAGDRTLSRRVHTDGSYASASDPRVVFGLGGFAGNADLGVRWPDGSEEVFAGLATGRYHELVQGSGRSRK